MGQIEKVLYTGQTRTSGGREGVSRSSDGRLDIKLSSPGAPGRGTNPEQLFAAGWSACFIGAMGLAARKLKIALPADTAVDAEVDLGTAGDAYFLQARLTSACLAWSGTLRRPWWITRTRLAHTPRLRGQHQRHHQSRLT